MKKEMFFCINNKNVVKDILNYISGKPAEIYEAGSMNIEVRFDDNKADSVKKNRIKKMVKEMRNELK